MSFDRNGLRTDQPAPTPPDPARQAAVAQGSRSLEQQTLDRVREGLTAQLRAPAPPPVEPDPAAEHADLVQQVGRSRDVMLQRLGRRPTVDPVTLPRPSLAAAQAAPAVQPRPGQQAEVHDALAQMRQALRLPPLPFTAA